MFRAIQVCPAEPQKVQMPPARSIASRLHRSQITADKPHMRTALIRSADPAGIFQYSATIGLRRISRRTNL